MALVIQTSSGPQIPSRRRPHCHRSSFSCPGSGRTTAIEPLPGCCRGIRSSSSGKWGGCRAQLLPVYLAPASERAQSLHARPALSQRPRQLSTTVRTTAATPQAFSLAAVTPLPEEHDPDPGNWASGHSGKLCVLLRTPRPSPPEGQTPPGKEADTRLRCQGLHTVHG